MSNLKDSIKSAPPQLKRKVIYIFGIAIVLLIGITVYKQYQIHREAEAREAEIKAGPRVRVTPVVMSKGDRSLKLTGETRPFSSVTLYAKVSGYLNQVMVDKGDKVKAGQVLATIDSPETNKAYEGAAADARNKKGIASRMRELRSRNLVSAQEAEQAFSDDEVARSKLESASTLKGYETLRAPFDGTVTARFVDPGALVQNAENSQTSAQPVVTVAQLEKLRVYIYIDQRDASYVKPGADVLITVAERPGFQLPAKVERVSGELDPTTRMLLTEIDLDNSKADLVAGSFVQVSLNLKTPTFLQVPVEALISQGEKSMVPVVDSTGSLKFHEVKVADDDGKTVSLLEGVKEGDMVALNVGNSIADGSQVRPMPLEEAKPAEAKPADNKPAATPKAAESAPETKPAMEPREPAPASSGEAAKDK